MRWINLGAMALTATVGFAAGCASSDGSADSEPKKLPQISECQAEKLPLYKDGTLTIATGSRVFEPWFQGGKPGNGKGYEGAVARAVGERLGFRPQQIDWVKAGYEDALKSADKSYDFDINQFTITKGRAKNVDFSVPYYQAQQAVVVLKKSKFAEAASVKDLSSARLGAQVGTTSLNAAKELKTKQDPRAYDDLTKAAAALRDGQIDAVIADVPTAFALIDTELEDAKLLGQFKTGAGKSERFGLVLEKGSKLTGCVSAAIESLREDGTLNEFEKSWLSDSAGLRSLD